VTALDNLNQHTPIVDDRGCPTREFMIKWQQLKTAAGAIAALLTAAEVSTVLDVLGAHEGDVLVRGASLWQELAIGASGEVLTSNGVVPGWAALPSGTPISTQLDTIGSAQGDVLYRGATGWAALAPGVSGDVLTTAGAGANPSWQPGSGGGASYYELGEFHPPSAGTFSTAMSTTLVSDVVCANISLVGLQLYGTFGGANAMLCAMRAPTGWTTPWAVVARLKGSVFHANYPQYGLFMIDTTGKVQGVHTVTVTAPAQYNEYDFRLNNVNTSYNATGLSVQVTKPAEWFRIRCDGTNYYFGTSYDNVMWEEYSTTIAAWLGTLAYVGIAICYWQSASVGLPANSGGVLCTYYSDPSYP
jgi:hypothetical protein